jgi:transposase-like protein
MWYVVSQKTGVSALGLQRVLGLPRYETVWIWLHKLRRAMVRQGRDKISGTVEADETYMGGERPGKAGRGAKGKSLVFIAVEDKGTELGRIRLQRIPNGSAESLNKAVEDSIAKGSTIRTDGWHGYDQLASLGYEHMIVHESEELRDNLLPLAHRVAALLKKWIQGTHQGAVRASHLDYYLEEFTFRFNRRTSRSRGKLFYRLVQQAVAVGPVTGEQVRGCRSIVGEP